MAYLLENIAKQNTTAIRNLNKVAIFSIATMPSSTIKT